MRFLKLPLATGIVLCLATCAGEAEEGADRSPGEEGAIDVVLSPQVPGGDSERGMRWSPYGQQLPLTEVDGGMNAQVNLGSEGTPPIGLRLVKGLNAAHFNHLYRVTEIDASGRTVAFLHDFAEAQALAREEAKALFVDFETTWCGPCKTMDEWVYTADDVVDASQSVVAVKVDGEEHPDLKDRFGVAGFPTMILLSSVGEELRRASGYVNVAAMAEFLKGSE